jgi:zinc D-Ala-D-Ala dipeptidase
VAVDHLPHEFARRDAAPADVPPPADAAPPPRPDDLVDLAVVDPRIVLDLRYATADNFLHHEVYPVARCLLRRAVAERLVRVEDALAADGLGLAMWDCYRPFSVQKAMWALEPDERYVARPVEKDKRPVAGSKHNRGAAVDLTLVDADGHEAEMPTPFDDFGRRAHRHAAHVGKVAAANAERLERAMVAEGFLPLATEWWHFDAPGWERFPLEDQPLR